MLSRMSRLHVSDQLRGILIKPTGIEIKGETGPAQVRDIQRCSS
jgi:hypothetical protein